MMTILGVIGHILLVLLKILLILLAVILLLVLIVLILPIRYEAAARGDSRKGLPSVYAQARVNVLLGLISLRIMLKEGSLVYSAKLLSFSLKKGKTRLYGAASEDADAPEGAAPEDTDTREGEKPAAEPRKTAAGETAPAEKPAPAEEPPDATSNTSERPHAEAGEPPAETETPAESQRSAESSSERSGESAAEEEKDIAGAPAGAADSEESHKAGIKDRIRAVLSRFRKKPEAEPTGERESTGKKPPWRPRPLMERILDLTDAVGGILDGAGPGSAADGAADRVLGIGDRIGAAGDKAALLMDKAQEPSVIRTVQRVKKALFRILRAYLPREVRLDGEFGTGDPAGTGQALGWIYTFYPMYCEKGDIRVAGNFEETMVKGKLYLKGHIRLIVAVGSALLLLPDRNIRKLIKKLLGGGKHGTE